MLALNLIGEATHRTCTACGAWKPLTDFSPHAHGKYGKQSRCKGCCTEANSARYHANIETARIKSRARAAEYRLLHPEAKRASHAAWAARNPERDRESKRRWDERNAEHKRIYKLAWHAANRAKAVEHTKEYRRRKSKAEGACSAAQLRARINMFGGKCWFPKCGKDFEAIDHVIPLSDGGTNWPANLRPICWRHNSIKGAQSWRLFART